MPGALGERRLRIVEAEVVEIQMAPAGVAVVHQPNEDLFADVGLQIDDHGCHIFDIRAGGAEDCLLVLFQHQLDAGRFVTSAADQERGVRRGDFERRRGERAARPIRVQLVAAYPKVALVPALHGRFANVDDVAFDRLVGEGVARGMPVLERAGFEVQVQPAVPADPWAMRQPAG